MSILEYNQMAGALRNSLMLLRGLDKGDPEFDDKICAGITWATVTAITKAMRQGRIPELNGCSYLQRELGIFKVNHRATQVRPKDGENWYVFDWHATVKANDPAINSAELWSLGVRGTNYTNFNGIDLRDF
jgi:hypothetical protein